MLKIITIKLLLTHTFSQNIYSCNTQNRLKILLDNVLHKYVNNSDYVQYYSAHFCPSSLFSCLPISPVIGSAFSFILCKPSTYNCLYPSSHSPPTLLTHWRTSAQDVPPCTLEILESNFQIHDHIDLFFTHFFLYI